MVCSPAQIAANRRNAALSTGPRTASGKKQSRRNALKHGMTGAGVALPDEDSAAVETRFEAFEADLKPKGAVAEFVVRQVALMSVRMERCARHESAELTRDMLRAGDVEADARDEELKRLIASIADDPASVARKLRRSPEGIDWMIGRWEWLKAELLDRAIERWSKPHRELADRLTGREPVVVRGSRITSLSLAVLGDLRLLDESDWPGLPDPARREAARAELAKIIDAEIARLRSDREGLDHEAIALDRAGAPARALFGVSREAVLARRYEAAASREFYRGLKQVERLNEAAEPEQTAVNHDETTGYRESGSFCAAEEVEPEGGVGMTIGRRTLPPTRPDLPPDRPRKAPSGLRDADLRPGRGSRRE